MTTIQRTWSPKSSTVPNKHWTLLIRRAQTLRTHSPLWMQARPRSGAAMSTRMGHSRRPPTISVNPLVLHLHFHELLFPPDKLKGLLRLRGSLRIRGEFFSGDVHASANRYCNRERGAHAHGTLLRQAA